MVRYLIERYLKLGRVIKGLNFIGDADNEITEILTLNKHVKAIISATDALITANKKRHRGTY